MKQMTHRSFPKYRSAMLALTPLAAALMFAPAVASAQGVMTVRATRAGTAPMNSCVRLKFMPSPLVDSPEGLEVLKMQREISQTREFLLSRSDTLNPALKQVMVVGMGVDSLVRFFVNGQEGPQGRVLVRSQINGEGEAQRQMLSQSERMLVESMIREIQPKFDEAVRGGFVTINVRSTAPGYLGVSTTTSTFPSVLEASRPFGYCEYPRVETVDPGSPAEKAGLSAGDTLLAYNNRDLLQFDVNYQSLLVPGRPLHIKFRRDGQVREVAPVIMRRETDAPQMQPARTSCTSPNMRAECEGPRLVMSISGSPMPMSGGVAPARARLVPSILFPTGPREAFFGGAELRVITEGFGKALGLTSGMLVLNSNEGSPAYLAGIREGDVIVSVNGTVVRDNNSLSNALSARMGDRTALLVLSNAAGQRTVNMRW